MKLLPTKEIQCKLRDRRAGIEPLIGHAKLAAGHPEVAVGKLRVYLRFQFEAIDQAPMWENEESCLMDREHGTSSDRGCEKKLVVIRRDPSLRSGHVAGAFAPATS